MSTRKNTKWRSINLTNEQDARLVKLADKCGLNPNSLLRLVAERLQPSDVEQLLKRG